MPGDFTPRNRSRSANYRSVSNRSPQREEYLRRGALQPMRPSRKKAGPPPILILFPLLLVVLLVVILIVVFFPRGDGTQEPDASQGSSQVSSVEDTSSGTESGDPSEAPVVSVPSIPAITATPPPEKIPSGTPEITGDVVSIGNTGYELYEFDEEATNQYITLVSRVGNSLSGTATVYDLIIPTAVDISLSEKYILEHNIESSDQRKAIEKYIFPSINGMAPGVKTVSVFDALKVRNNDALYFRTDPSWTQLGAYYAYVEFCRAKGLSPIALGKFKKETYSGFLGSFYQDYSVGDADAIDVYLPENNHDVHYTTSDGETYSQPMIMDGTDYSSQWMYLIFCAGDQPYKEIVNSEITDGSVCVVVMESEGNVFLPFLTNHYQTVIAVDYRSYEGNILSLVRQKGARDLIFLNGITMTSSSRLVRSLDNSFS